MKKILIKTISLYQELISSRTKPHCVFYPSCSEYAKNAIEKYGVLKGTTQAFLRILRCHPWQKNHIDFA